MGLKNHLTLQMSKLVSVLGLECISEMQLLHFIVGSLESLVAPLLDTSLE